MLEAPDLYYLAPGADAVPVSPRVTASLYDVRYDTEGGHFWWGDLRVSGALEHWQKLAFPTFAALDEAEKDRLYREHAAARGVDVVEAGPVTAWGAFWQGVSDDVTSLANKARSFFGVGPENAAKMSGLQVALFIIAALAALFLLWKIITAWRAAR